MSGLTSGEALAVHTCSFDCERPPCMKAQRRELLDCIAELEAGIGRLADEWEAGPAKGFPHMRPCDLEANAQARCCATELRSLLRITHEEGE